MLIKRKQEEDGIQGEIIDLLKVSAIDELLYFSVPNGGRRAWKTAITMKDTGQLEGMTDIVLIHPVSLIAHCMEVKTKKGSLSKAQREIRDRCKALGIPWAVVHSRDEAQDQLTKWGMLRVRDAVPA